MKIMGIVNVTPDSFSDGGQYNRPEEAVKRALNLASEGADILDLGGESTRPGATPLDWATEWARVEPVLKRLAELREAGRQLPRLSIDTYHPETAAQALQLGVDIVNCVKVEPIAAMIDAIIAAKREKLELVLPATTPEPIIARAREAGIKYYLDPMIGFGTTREEDLAMLRNIAELTARGPVLVGASRKRIVQTLTGTRKAGRNLGGSVAVALWCAAAGVQIVRVHDVFETAQAVKAWTSLQ